MRERRVLVCCILASSLVGMDGMMTTVALPAMAEDLGAGLAEQQWIVAAFLLAVGGLLLAGGALGDVYGRARMLMVGVAAFGVAGVVSAVAPNAWLLIGGRLLQGVAAACVLPSVLAVITATFAGERRSRAISAWSAWSGLSVIAGPLIGGLLVDLVSWRAVYLAELPLAVVTLVLAVRIVAESPAEQRVGGRIDVVGAVLTVPSVGGVAFYLIQGPRTGWTHPGSLAAVIIGVVALVALIAWERRVANPLLPLRLFRVRTFSILNLVTFLLYGGLIGAGTYTVIYLQDGLGYHPALAGVIGAVPIIVLFILAGRVGTWSDRYGRNGFVAAGSVVAGLGILLLMAAGSNPVVILVSVTIHGVGLALLVPPLTSGVMSAVDDRWAGVASGINNAVARTGSMIAIAVVGAVISLQFAASLDRELAGPARGPEFAAAVEAAKSRPLARETTAELTEQDRAALQSALAAASTVAFRAAAGVTGGLAVIAGIIAFVGTRQGGRRSDRYDAAGSVGCAITGARSHPDAPPIGPAPAQGG